MIDLKLIALYLDYNSGCVLCIFEVFCCGNSNNIVTPSAFFLLNCYNIVYLTNLEKKTWHICESHIGKNGHDRYGGE